MVTPVGNIPTESPRLTAPLGSPNRSPPQANHVRCASAHGRDYWTRPSKIWNASGNRDCSGVTTNCCMWSSTAALISSSLSGGVPMNASWASSTTES